MIPESDELAESVVPRFDAFAGERSAIRVDPAFELLYPALDAVSAAVHEDSMGDTELTESVPMMNDTKILVESLDATSERLHEMFTELLGDLVGRDRKHRPHGRSVNPVQPRSDDREGGTILL